MKTVLLQASDFRNYDLWVDVLMQLGVIKLREEATKIDTIDIQLAD